VAGIDLLWRSSPAAITDSVKNAVKLTEQLGLRSLAMPLIGAGSGSFDEASSERLICQTLASLTGTLEVLVVRFRE
jgi:O-acetyl-ADP-ribose deacetylase (regulator of RNase III)